MPLDGNETEYETKPLTEVQKVLLRAAEIIEQRGWCQFTREDDEERVCLLGAIGAAKHGNPWRGGSDDPEAQPVRKYLGASLAPWNNRPGRTQSEVIAALRTAALDTSKGE